MLAHLPPTHRQAVLNTAWTDMLIRAERLSETLEEMWHSALAFTR